MQQGATPEKSRRLLSGLTAASPPHPHSHLTPPPLPLPAVPDVQRQLRPAGKPAAAWQLSPPSFTPLEAGGCRLEAAGWRLCQTEPKSQLLELIVRDDSKKCREIRSKRNFDLKSWKKRRKEKPPFTVHLYLTKCCLCFLNKVCILPLEEVNEEEVDRLSTDISDSVIHARGIMRGVCDLGRGLCVPCYSPPLPLSSFSSSTHPSFLLSAGRR